MLTRREWWIISIETCVHFKCNIEIDLDLYMRVRTCETCITGKQLSLCPYRLNGEPKLANIYADKILSSVV